MSFEFIFVLDIIAGFTAYYFWFHNKLFPKIGKTSIVSGILFILLSCWLLAAGVACMEVESVEIYDVQKRVRSDGAVESVIVVNDQTVNVSKQIHAVVPPNKKVKLTRYRQSFLGIKLIKYPLIEIIETNILPTP